MSSIAEKLSLIAENVTKVFGSGYNAGTASGRATEYNAFWDAFQENGKADVDYRYKFFYWRDASAYNPKYPIYTNKANCTSTFSNSWITDTKVDIDMRYAKDVSYMFSYCQRLITIRKFIVSTNTTNYNGTFNNCSSLENITIEGVIGSDFDIRYSPLTKASIESIITHLSTTASGKTVSFKKSAVNTAFETSSGANNGSTSTEWTTLIQPYSNWTISLV